MSFVDQAYFDKRFDTMEEMIKEHFENCKESCMLRIEKVEIKIDKTQECATDSHRRLDKHVDAIECLTAEKNQQVGFRKAISAVVVVISIIVSIIGLDILWR